MNEEDKIYHGKDVKYGLKKALKLGYKDGLKEGFQKGKLEERERIRQLLGFFQSNMKVINEDEAQIRIDDWEDLKEQLQKEIGEEKGK
jgi:flagellar biosynthesis/type III secretory pathway protein FliH